jgi:hypothetical protein
MSGPVEIVVILAAVAFVLVRRMIGEPAKVRSMLVVPAALSAYGLYEVVGAGRTPASLAFLVGTAAISVVIGALRGLSVRMTRRDGYAFIRYTAVTIGLWVLNLALKFGANLLAHGVDPKNTAAGFLLPVGLGLLAEGLVVYYRALRGNHPVVALRAGRGVAGIR